MKQDGGYALLQLMSDPKNKSGQPDNQPDKNLAEEERSVPSQAEGDRETIEEDLKEKEEPKKN